MAGDREGVRALSTSRKASGLRELVAAQEERARPALAARDNTARALARALLDVAARAEQEAGKADRQADSLRDRADEFGEGQEDAARRAGREREKARGAEEKIGEVRELLATQIRAGLLREGADVAAEAEIAQEQAETAAEAVTKALAGREELAKAVRAADSRWHAAQRTEAGARSAAEKADAAATLAAGIAESLADEERLAELLGAESIELDTDSPTSGRRHRCHHQAAAWLA